MRVFFRCDASTVIGSGHVMRCLTLAIELRKNGADVSFICSDIAGNLNKVINSHGFALYTVSTASDSVLQNEDALKTIEVLTKYTDIDWLIVDHYLLDFTWEKAIRPYVHKILVIDDLANRRHDCDILLDQNLFHKMHLRYSKLIPSYTQTLLGPAYALLRNEFREARSKIKNSRTKMQRLFIFFGGADVTNETAKVLEAIKMLGKLDLAVDVVVGASNPYKEEIRHECEVMKGINFYCQINNIASLMAQADFSIGGGGSSVWERCCLGLPSIVVPVADNQIEPMRELAKVGAILLFGKERSPEGYLSILQDVFLKRKPLDKMTQIGLNLFDANGAKRVAEKLL